MISKMVVPAVIGVLFASPLTTVGAGGLAAQIPAGHAPQPLVPLQFTPVKEADWTAEKPLVGQEIECRNGKIRIFDCQNVSLLSFLPENDVGGPLLTDLWGWTDAATGRAFVLAGREGGTSFIEITDPVNPRYLGELPFHEGAEPSRFRDVKVYKDHAFIVSDEAGEHGMQVFDLAQLLAVRKAPVVFRETAHYDRIASSINLVIDTATGFAYAVGNRGGREPCDSGLHMIDIHDPVKPAFAGCYAETLGGSRQSGYVQDAQCIVYHGPDRRYSGREICVNATGDAIGIADVTDKQHPKSVGVGRYPNVGYAFQGWLSEDQRYFFLADEIDEEQQGGNTRTIIFDLQALDHPVVAKEFRGTTFATDHNQYVRGRYLYQSDNFAGLRVLDVSDPVNPKEVAYFDPSPEDDNVPAFAGSWSNYPYFKDGLIAVSNNRSTVGNGLFILRYRPAAR